MAAYPSLTTTMESTLVEVDGQVVDYMENNQPRVRNYADASRWEGVFIHVLNATDMHTLLTFYDDNRNAEFTYTWDAEGTGSPWVVTYNLRFAGAVRWDRIVAAASDPDAIYRAEVEVVGTAA